MLTCSNCRFLGGGSIWYDPWDSTRQPRQRPGRREPREGVVPPPVVSRWSPPRSKELLVKLLVAGTEEGSTGSLIVRLLYHLGRESPQGRPSPGKLVLIHVSSRTHITLHAMQPTTTHGDSQAVRAHPGGLRQRGGKRDQTGTGVAIGVSGDPEPHVPIGNGCGSLLLGELARGAQRPLGKINKTDA